MTDDEVQDLTNYQNVSEQLFLPGEEKSLLEQATKICFYTITIAVGLCANGLIIGVISATKSLRTKFNFYVVNLAFADVLVVVFCSWIHLVSDLKQQWILGSFMCTANTFVQVTVVSASILTLTITVVDRYLASKHPRLLQYTQTCQGGMILAIWTAAILVALPWALYVRQVEFQWATGLEIDCEDLFPSQDIKKIYITFFAVVLYVIPLCTMFSLLFEILNTPKLQTRISEQSFPRNESQNEHQVSMTRFSDQVQERRISLNMELHQMKKMRQNAAVMILTLLVVFFICWTPQQTTLLWDVYRDRHKKKPNGIVAFKYIALYLAYSSSAVYPVVYMMFNKCFRIAAWKSLRFWKRGEHSVFTVSPCKYLSNQFSADQADTPL